MKKNVSLKLTQKCKKWLTKKGYSSEFGARNIARIIQENIKNFFVDEVLFGKLSTGGKTLADIKNDKVVIQILNT